MTLACDDDGVAGRFASQRVLACRQMGQRMEEKPVLRRGGHPVPPQVAALRENQLMGQRHVQFVGVQGPHVVHW